MSSRNDILDTYDGKIDAGMNTRFAVITARFNAPITEALLDGAMRAFEAHGVDASSVVKLTVPGAFELPIAAKRLASTGEYAAIVCLGCVIQGETAHFDFVAGEAASGINQAALDTGVPVIFGVLTTDTEEQAKARSGAGKDNKGYEAALSAMAVSSALDELAPLGEDS